MTFLHVDLLYLFYKIHIIGIKEIIDAQRL